MGKVVWLVLALVGVVGLGIVNYVKRFPLIDIFAAGFVMSSVLALVMFFNYLRRESENG